MKIFWSWQSDTPGRTGRHFVRDCLLAAIERLKASNEVSEPTEREARESMHLDHDRLGVSGSPDLASVIFGKIDASEVFVADVTPVSSVAAKVLADGTRSRRKQNMNPNVAIELGYALKTPGTESVLMILNEHYGKRESLPFDLANKAGPLMYRLAPDATNDQIQKQQAHLVGQLAVALKPFLGRGQKAESLILHEPTPSLAGPATFFDRAKPLAVTEGWSAGPVQHLFAEGPAFYLRILPTTRISTRLAKSSLLDAIQKANLCTLTRAPGGGTARANEYGAIVFEDAYSTQGAIQRATQVFSNGELWGFSGEFTVAREEKPYVATGAVEKMFELSLRGYLAFARDHLGLGPNVRAIGGGAGLRGYALAVKGCDRPPRGGPGSMLVEQRLLC